MEVAKDPLTIITFKMIGIKLLDSQMHIRVEGEKRITPQVMYCAATPGLPHMHIELTKHLKRKQGRLFSKAVTTKNESLIKITT